MQLSEKGLKFLEAHETADGKLNLTAYNASGKKHKGDWTIGYRHKIKPGEDFSKGINAAQAAALLTSDVQTAVNAVNNSLKYRPIFQSEFDAMCSAEGRRTGRNVARQAAASSDHQGHRDHPAGGG